jgi:hypothetical protein
MAVIRVKRLGNCAINGHAVEVYANPSTNRVTLQHELHGIATGNHRGLPSLLALDNWIESVAGLNKSGAAQLMAVLNMMGVEGFEND